MTAILNTQIAEQTITAERLLSAFTAAAYAVQDSKNKINEVNFFPVADKDTGENVAATLQAIDEIALKDSSMKTVLNAVSQSIFENSRGNSGLILSIWFIGIESFETEATTWTLLDVRAVLKAGANHLNQEMENAMPGTMVSFLMHFTAALQEATALSEILDALSLCLEETKRENATSKAHNVVDAGALALHIFLKHFFETLYSENKPELVKRQLTQSEFHHDHYSHEQTEAPTFRYCTEAYVELPEANMTETIATIKSKVEPLGDCSLITHRGQQLHLHIHTNEPALLFSHLYAHGRVSKPKVEDMLRQYQSASTKKPIALVTDSSADIDKALLEKYQIHLLPLSVSFDNQEGLDPYTIEKETFYKRLLNHKQHPKTSSPSQKKIKALLTFLSQHYEKILVITISSKMSSTYKSFVNLAQRFEKVKVFDSRTNSGAHGLLVLKAAEMIEKNQPMRKLLNTLEAYRAQVSIFVGVHSTTAMLASGRVAGLKASVLKWLKPKLLVSVNPDGSGKVTSMLLFNKNLHNRLLKLVVSRYKKNQFRRYCVLYVTDKTAAERLAEDLFQSIKMKPMYIGTISSVVSIHAGQSAIAVAFD